MIDLVKSDQRLPVEPTAADTADWYRLGDAVEKHGRHMKRQAVAAEYNSGREMKAWFTQIGQPEQTMRSLLQEAHNLGLTSVSTLPDSGQLSQALPTQTAAREYAKAEPEVREVIKEIIKEDPEAEIKAAEIRRLRSELTKTKEERDDAVRHINTLEVDKVQTMVNDLGLRTSINGLLGDLGSGLADEYLQSVEASIKESVLARMVELSKLLACVAERNQMTHLNPTFIDV